MSYRESFADQLDNQRWAGRSSTYAERLTLAEQVGSVTDEVTAPFTSTFAPSEMRQLALVAHNHMKPAMKQFIETYSEILKKFRITGTQTTMKMCKSMWGEDDPSIHYGLTCTSGPLGGDAQIASLMCVEDLGGIIFFVDPLSAHPHQADIDSLLRLANCGNIIVCPNPASASSMMHTLRCALLKGDNARGMIPSFFETLESPAVAEYKYQQAAALAKLANVIKGGSPSAPALQAAEPPKEVIKEVGKSVSFGTEMSVSSGEPAHIPMVEEKKKKKMANVRHVEKLANISDSILLCESLQTLLAVELDDGLDDEEEEGSSVEETPTAKVSKGLFGIKTSSTKKSSRETSGLKKLGKRVRRFSYSKNLHHCS